MFELSGKREIGLEVAAHLDNEAADERGVDLGVHNILA